MITTALKLNLRLSELDYIGLAQFTELAIMEAQRGKNSPNQPHIRKATQKDMDRF